MSRVAAWAAIALYAVLDVIGGAWPIVVLYTIGVALVGCASAALRQAKDVAP